MIVYRVQDAEGRGPFRPGLSRYWVEDRPDHENLLPWTEEFGDVIPRTGWPFGKHFGCACRTIEQLRRWFSDSEYKTLQRMGFQAVQMEVDRVLAESDKQLVFQRAKPLRCGVEPIGLYEVSSESSAVFQTPSFLRSNARVQAEAVRAWMSTPEGKAAIEKAGMAANASIRELDAARVIPWQLLQEPFTI